MVSDTTIAEVLAGNNCCGCSLCMTICPKNAIKMVQDSYGFVIPRISGQCINCGVCLRACPMSEASKLADNSSNR